MDLHSAQRDQVSWTDNKQPLHGVLGLGSFTHSFNKLNECLLCARAGERDRNRVCSHMFAAYWRNFQVVVSTSLQATVTSLYFPGALTGSESFPILNDGPYMMMGHVLAFQGHTQ